MTPHGIIDLGRSYAAGGARVTTERQDRRITQEIFRDLVSLVPGVDAEQLLETLKSGLDEHGIGRDRMENLLRFYDAMRAGLVSGPEQAQTLVPAEKLAEVVRLHQSG